MPQGRQEVASAQKVRDIVAESEFHTLWFGHVEAVRTVEETLNILGVS